jgi:hypothetical protein
MTRVAVFLAACGVVAGAAETGARQQPMGQPPASGQAPPPAPPDGSAGSKVCVPEAKATTRTVYTSVCKEFCAPPCRLLDHVRRWCGMPAACPADGCGELKAYRVLVKKTVPGPPAVTCVVKDAPVGPPAAPCMPTDLPPVPAVAPTDPQAGPIAPPIPPPIPPPGPDRSP